MGRLEPVKGHQHFLAAIGALRDLHPRLRALIIGDGPLREEIEATVRHLGLAERVFLLGFRSDVGDLMSAVDVGVFCSDHEGLPYAALEFMARGVPIVAHAVGGLREVVSHDENGLLVDPTAPGALRYALAGLARDPERVRTLGTARPRSRARTLLAGHNGAKDREGVEAGLYVPPAAGWLLDGGCFGPA